MSFHNEMNAIVLFFFFFNKRKKRRRRTKLFPTVAVRWGAASGNGQRSREHRGPAWRAAVHSRRWGPHFILNFGWIWIYFFFYFFIPPHFVRFELETRQISYSNSVQIRWIRWVFNWQICVGLRSNGSGAFYFIFFRKWESAGVFVKGNNTALTVGLRVACHDLFVNLTKKSSKWDECATQHTSTA